MRLCTGQSGTTLEKPAYCETGRPVGRTFGLAEVAAEAAELDEPVLVTTLRQLVQARHRSCAAGDRRTRNRDQGILVGIDVAGTVAETSSGGIFDRW